MFCQKMQRISLPYIRGTESVTTCICTTEAERLMFTLCEPYKFISIIHPEIVVGGKIIGD